MLRVEQAGKRYGETPVLNDVSLEMAGGSVLAVLGPNGAGKSTLFRLLTGEIKPDQGTVFWSGHPLGEVGLATLARYRAAMNQTIHIPFPISAREVVMMGRAPFFGWKETRLDQEIVEEMLERVEMRSLALRDFPTLSGGEKQRIHLARVLAQMEGLDRQVEGKCLLLDEPASALDLKHRHDVLKMCRQLAQRGAAVLIIMHDLNSALSYSDQVLVLNHGSTYCHGPTAECLTAEVVSRVFELPMTHHKDHSEDRGYFRPAG